MKFHRVLQCFFQKYYKQKTTSVLTRDMKISIQSKFHLRHLNPSRLLISCALSYSSASKFHTSAFHFAKHFQDTENEYAHHVMEKNNFYSSVRKHPLSCEVPKFRFSSVKEFNEFESISMQNFCSTQNIENDKFSPLINIISQKVDEGTDEDIVKLLHCLCLWPPTDKTFTPNFKAIWNSLDDECVNRLKNWDTPKVGDHEMKNSLKHLVFVYGTLKTYEPNYHLFQDSSKGKVVFKGKGRTVKKWPLVIASRYNIPYLLYHDKGKHVIGELFQVDDKMLETLDELENHPDYYTRINDEEVEVLSGDFNSKVVKPWIYFLKKFRQEMLLLPYLEDYSSKGSHGLEYVSRYYRSSENYYSDVFPDN